MEARVSEIRPFRGLRPLDELAARIIAPPYDVLSEDEARAIAGPNEMSFLHVTRPEVDLPEGSDAHGPEAHAKARENLDLFQQRGWMVQDERPCFYLYRQTWRGRTQTGLMAACSVKEYDEGLIKKHELTRPDKEQDRVDNMTALDAQPGLVFLAYRDDSEAVRGAISRASAAKPVWTVTTEDEVEHSLAVVDDPVTVGALVGAFSKLSALYVADGHHRSAAASRVAAARSGSGSSGRFLAGLFPDSELDVLAYNRVVRDLNGRNPDAFLEAVGEHFEITADAAPMPSGRGRWSMYLVGQWYGLVAKEGVVPNDPVGSLDVAVLQDRILGPLLGIDNPRTDTRIDFVGGIRGHRALEARVDRGEAEVAFHLYPTGMDQLFAVADADKLMPPKSTWFEPKLRGGVVLHKIS
jgi:uncharacterized protein (DUF1015 family)